MGCKQFMSFVTVGCLSIPRISPLFQVFIIWKRSFYLPRKYLERICLTSQRQGKVGHHHRGNTRTTITSTK